MQTIWYYYGLVIRRAWRINWDTFLVKTNFMHFILIIGYTKCYKK